MKLDFRIIKVLKSAFKLLAHFQEFTKHIRVEILVVLYLSILADLGDCIIGARFFCSCYSNYAATVDHICVKMLMFSLLLLYLLLR